MSQILNHLFALGYITRQPPATEKRKVFTRLSAGSRALIPGVRQEADAWLRPAPQATCSAEEPAGLLLFSQTSWYPLALLWLVPSACRLMAQTPLSFTCCLPY